MILSKIEMIRQKFKYQPLTNKKEVKKLKKQLIALLSDYLDYVLQEFVIVYKKQKKKIATRKIK